MKTIKPKINRTNYNKFDFDKILPIAILLLIVSGIFISYSKKFDIDEIEAMHTAWKILMGEKIYIDFFQHHHSLFYYLLMPIITIFGETAKSLIYARLYFYAIFLLIVYITYKIASIDNNKRISLISVILLLSFTLFSYKAVEIRPDLPQIALILLAIYHFLLYLRNNSIKTLIISAISLGLAFLILQKTVFVIAIIGLIQLYYLIKKEISKKSFLLFWITFLITIFPYYFYLLLTNNLSTYFTFNWLINMEGSSQFSPIQNLKNSYHQNTIHWIFYFIAILFIPKNTYIKFMIIVSVALILLLFLVNAPYLQYFIIITPFVSILSAKSMHTLFKNNIPILYFILLLSIIPYFFEFQKTHNNKNDIKRLQYVLDNTNKNDKVFDGLSYINLYRKDIDFFWFSVYEHGLLEIYQNMTNYHYDIYELIDRYKPKVIFAHTINNMNHKNIKPYYYQSIQYPRIYIRKTNIN
ncbi:MAG: hypothetical protein GWP19_08800 [Planctomycetia bacterium]|nr:hypothetical protein [Planctomycetia bacterium]